jgi:hypothetical protein
VLLLHSEDEHIRDSARGAVEAAPNRAISEVRPSARAYRLKLDLDLNLHRKLHDCLKLMLKLGMDFRVMLITPE